MINVFAGKVRKTGFFQKAGFPGNSETIFGIYFISEAKPRSAGRISSTPCRHGTGRGCFALKKRVGRFEKSVIAWLNGFFFFYCGLYSPRGLG
jgi:hypothetical protein